MTIGLGSCLSKSPLPLTFIKVDSCMTCWREERHTQTNNPYTMPGFRKSIRSFFSRSFRQQKHQQAQDKSELTNPSRRATTSSTHTRTRTRSSILSTHPTRNMTSRDRCIHCECEFESGYGAPFRPCEHTGMHYRCARLLFRFQQSVSCPTCGATLDLTTEVDDSWRSRKSVDSRMVRNIVGGGTIEWGTTMNTATITR